MHPENERELVHNELETCLQDQLHKNLDLIAKIKQYKLFFDKIEEKKKERNRSFQF